MSKGKYSFGMHHRFWRIWDDTGKCVKIVETREEALEEVYRLNGWGKPKKRPNK